MSNEPIVEGEPRIAAAVGTAVGHSSLGGKELTKRLESAMQQAVAEALAEGVSIEDSDTLRERQLAARAAVLRSLQAPSADDAA
jgi:hypothetical protein